MIICNEKLAWYFFNKLVQINRLALFSGWKCSIRIQFYCLIFKTNMVRICWPLFVCLNNVRFLILCRVNTTFLCMIKTFATKKFLKILLYNLLSIPKCTANICKVWWNKSTYYDVTLKIVANYQERKTKDDFSLSDRLLSHVIIKQP